MKAWIVYNGMVRKQYHKRGTPARRDTAEARRKYGEWEK